MAYAFGLGSGWLPKSVAKIARKHGAELVNHTDVQCTCGYGCSPGECKASRRHWFECDNYGEPHDSRVRLAVLADLGELSTVLRRRTPAAIGNAVMLCESCGAKFRVVSAMPRKTGSRLAEMVKQSHVFHEKTRNDKC